MQAKLPGGRAVSFYDARYGYHDYGGYYSKYHDYYKD